MKKIFLIILSFVSTILYASPINESRARALALDFFGGPQTRSAASDVRLVWSGNGFGADSAEGDALMYIYNSVGRDGFVVISGESRTEQIIACSHDRTFDLSNMSPGTRAILEGWCRQIESVRNSKTTSRAADVQENGFGNVVIKYDTPLWGQDEPFNREAPVYDGTRCVTGCVATAMSIIAYCNRYPRAGKGTTPEYEYDGKVIPANVLGREYAYDEMLMDYSHGYTERQADAVAALMKDMGTALQMMYGVVESAAYDINVPIALTEYMGYSKNMRRMSAGGYDYHSEWMPMLMANIDKCGPTYYSGAGQSGGHAFVLDGYTDAGYFSINYGWNGYNNGYYRLPDIDFYADQVALLDAVPDREGTSQYTDYLLLNSYEDFRCLQTYTDKFETGVPFNCGVFGIINMGMKNFEGHYKISLCDSQGNIKEDLVEIPMSCSSYDEEKENASIQVVISKDISVGDRLRLFYKGQYSETWQRMRGYDDRAVTEIILASSPEQIADDLRLHWSKETRTITIDTCIAVQCEIAGNGVRTEASAWPYSAVRMSLADFPSGEYVLKVTSGADPYEVVIVL